MDYATLTEENQERQAIILIHTLRLERVVSYRDQKERGRSLMPDKDERYRVQSFLMWSKCVCILDDLLSSPAQRYAEGHWTHQERARWLRLSVF